MKSLSASSVSQYLTGRSPEMSLDCLTARFMLCFCGGYVVRQASLAPLLGAFANGLRGRRSKGKRKGIRARDHAPKSSLPFPLLTPATQAISQTTLLASLRCRVTTSKLYLGVLDGTGSRGCLDFELANSLEETLSCLDAIWAGCFVNGRVRTPADHLPDAHAARIRPYLRRPDNSTSL